VALACGVCGIEPVYCVLQRLLVAAWCNAHNNNNNNNNNDNNNINTPQGANTPGIRVLEPSAAWKGPAERGRSLEALHCGCIVRCWLALVVPGGPWQ